MPFNDEVNFVLGNEGELFEDRETGEVSKYGITQKLLVAIRWQTTNPRVLTLEDAKGIIYSVFWEPNHLESIQNAQVRRKLLDMMVNMGSRQAIVLLQRSLNQLGETVAADGIMGSETLKKTQEVLDTHPNGSELLIQELKKTSVDFYKLIAEGPREKFLKGWISRANLG